MSDYLSRPCIAFVGTEQFAAGSLIDVALAIKAAEDDRPDASILVFDDASGAVGIWTCEARPPKSWSVSPRGRGGRQRRRGRKRLWTPMQSLAGVGDRNWVLLPERSRDCPDSGNGSPRNPAGRHRPCGVSLTRLAVPMAARPRPRPRAKPPTAF